MTDREAPEPYKLDGIGLMAKLGYKWAVDYPKGGTGYARTKRKVLELYADYINRKEPKP